MKKIYLLIPLLTLGTLSTVSCTGNRNNNSRVTFGTYVDQEAIEIKYSDFALKIARSENFLIATYEDTGFPCGCWTAFHEILNQYVQEYNTRIYYIGRSQFSEDDEKYGLTILNEGTNPTLAFMVDGQEIIRIRYMPLSYCGVGFYTISKQQLIVTKIEYVQ